MSDHEGRFRLRVAGLDAPPVHRDPVELGTTTGPEPEVRSLPLAAGDRAAGVRRFETTVDGWIFEIAVEDGPRALLRERAGQGAARGGRQGSDVVKAQIPGRIVRLWVAEGDTVEAGQRLLAIEAMKMENEVRAPRAGTVESIRVAPQSSVELGDELLTVR
ncbi:MAG: biotin/lipoyl-binding protein [Chloroflexota bacterium]|jgi:biotin carboxyl carrier protein